MTPEESRELSRRNRRSFLGLGAGLAAAWGAWTLASNSADSDGIPVAFRKTLQWNESVSSNLLYSANNLAPEFPASAIGELRENGTIGLGDDRPQANWQVALTLRQGTPPVKVGLTAIQELPEYRQTTEFKCIEGWSTVASWKGTRFSDFVKKFAPDSPRESKWVGLDTPDEEYYVGLDMASALHPQTMLAWELNGAPLTEEHGAPLRLVIPVKYGIKNIKRIATISFTAQRPNDYWAERGYDYYSGL
ncbi:MAG: molybdopterin-dependent oxidoreductase [Bryobacteraceae bacterium]|nr:molybdopterin-dependent oxidoreductase [Bryobacteraceae bacterium]